MKALFFYSSICLFCLSPFLLNGESPCDGKPKCGGIVSNVLPGEPYAHPYATEEDAQDAANNWDVGYEYNEETQQWIVFHPDENGQPVIPCSPANPPPPSDSPEHNPGAMDLTSPSDLTNSSGGDEDSGCSQ